MFLNNLNQNTSVSAIEKRKIFKSDTEIEKAIKTFLNGDVSHFGPYYCLPNALVYRKIITNVRTHALEMNQNIIALRLKDRVTCVGNGSILPLIGRGVSFGRESLNGSVTEVQTELAKYIPLVPFNVFEESGHNIMDLHFVDQGPEETLRVRVPNPKHRYDSPDSVPETILETRHYLGAKLFSVKDKLFLFDIDRREIDFNIFNAFLVELADNSVKTISEAYASLIPNEVAIAMNAGLKVKRQGEWFFIPVDGEYSADIETGSWNRGNNKRMELRAGQNRPNYASKSNEVSGLVSGKVEHSGREHADLILKGWYKPAPNTSIKSFTITGDVD